MSDIKPSFPFGFQINNKDGTVYRKYTRDTLQMLFSISPSAANFELMVVVESMVFSGIRSFYIMSKQEQEYDKFIADRRKSSLRGAVNLLHNLGIIDDSLQIKLDQYRKMRNDIAHDWFQVKTVYTKGVGRFREESHDQILRKLFQLGLETFVELGEIITPGRPTKDEYIKKFTGHYRRK